MKKKKEKEKKHTSGILIPHIYLVLNISCFILVLGKSIPYIPYREFQSCGANTSELRCQYK
jgi:hypothetical protein